MNNSKQNHRRSTRKVNSIQQQSNNILRHVQVDNRIFKRRLQQVVVGATNALGVINTVYAMDPSTAADWASCSALYDEFRVLGIAISLFPRQQFSVTALQNAIFALYDNDSVGVVTSYNEAAEFQTVKVTTSVWTTNRPFKCTWSRPTSGSETAIEWRDIGAPATSLGAAKIYGDALTASTQYFTVLVEWAVEFRGVR